MAIEIVSFPINIIVVFHSYVNVYQRVVTALETAGALPLPGLPDALDRNHAPAPVGHWGKRFVA